MNRMFKVGVAAFAMVAVSAAYADEAEVVEEENGAIGWTPIAVGIASPVQLPWGHCQWDVFGLDLGIFYYGAPKMYGLGVASLAALTKDEMKGLEVSGLMNWASKDVYGVRATLGANLAMESTVYGCEFGAFGYRKDFWGVDVEFLGSFQENVNGVQIGGLMNFARGQTYGFEGSLGVNFAELAYGCQLGLIFNMAQELHGAQVGLVNFADNCEWGFQIGLVNIIMSNVVKVLPIVNGSF